ncbi:unnamed protein product [Chrysodeixis includens]|uniref:Uncharacterized protein n=1 Tax=Chrysodeixis includens TaxID=689277 RepID=A0A9N8PXJ8_CHRIL|nr:unnamed protein product [Chrysodeixis includens]
MSSDVYISSAQRPPTRRGRAAGVGRTSPDGTENLPARRGPVSINLDVDDREHKKVVKFTVATARPREPCPTDVALRDAVNNTHYRVEWSPQRPRPRRAARIMAPAPEPQANVKESPTCLNGRFGFTNWVVVVLSSAACRSPQQHLRYSSPLTDTFEAALPINIPVAHEQLALSRRRSALQSARGSQLAAGHSQYLRVFDLALLTVKLFTEMQMELCWLSRIQGNMVRVTNVANTSRVMECRRIATYGTIRQLLINELPAPRHYLAAGASNPRSLPPRY